MTRDLSRGQRGETWLCCRFFLHLRDDPPAYCARFRGEKQLRRHWRRHHLARQEPSS
jgi:hypothetical protein